ncbi:B12-binding domain-containing radical SAM protein [Sorangium sp. So ce1128]
MVPSYFNAGHHLPVFQVGAYLRTSGLFDSIDCIDAAALNYNWKDICNVLCRGYDVIAVMNDFDQIDGFRRFSAYVRRLNPDAKLVTFGRLSQQIPGFFRQYGFDGIVASGDYETGVAGFARVVAGLSDSAPGVMLRSGDSYTSAESGVYLEAADWVLPDVDDIPYHAYDRMYGNDLNKFCGIPERRELVVPVARGCPVGCSFCDVPGMQGTTERRLSVTRTIEYIEESFRRLPFEYVSFYAPTFTLRKEWVRELCAALTGKGSLYPWKCVTTLAHLSEDLIREMAAAGCVRVSVGLETLDSRALLSLPKLKRSSNDNFEELAELFGRHGIELNCFVILGLPGDSPEGVAATVDRVLRSGARVRPAIYTPYQLLREDMDEAEVAMFNRQLLLDGLLDPGVADAYHRLFHANEKDRTTQVMKRIPRRSTEDVDPASDHDSVLPSL